MKALLAMLFAAVSVACSAPVERTETIAMVFTYEPGEWTPRERGTLASAAHRWNAETGAERVVLAPVEPGAVPTLSRVAPEEIPGLDGWWGLGTGIKVARVDEAVVTHELGHALGLGHVDSGVMQPNLEGRGPELSDADRAECVRVGECVPVIGEKL